MADDPHAEYERLYDEVQEWAATQDVDDPAYQQKLARLAQLALELGIVNDPGEEPPT